MNKEITLLLPTTGDPLVMYCFFKNLKKYKHLISNVFVSIDFMGLLNPTEFSLMEIYYSKFFDKQVLFDKLKYTFPIAIGQHGININNLLSNYEQEFKENVLLMEDDDLILNLDKFEFEINNFFDQNYDVAGVGRLSCTGPIGELLNDYIKNRNDLYLDTTLKPGEYYYNFWPTLFLTKTKYLLNSSRIFAFHGWVNSFKLGDKEWPIENGKMWLGDTFVKLSTEIYGNPEVKKIKIFSDIYRTDIHDGTYIPNIIDRSIDFHIGGLSEVLQYKLWIVSEDNNQNIINRIRNIKTSNNNRYITEQYKKWCVVQQMLYCIKDSSDFQFYENYKKNIIFVVEVFKNEFNMDEILNETLRIQSNYEPSILENQYKSVFNKIY